MPIFQPEGDRQSLSERKGALPIVQPDLRLPLVADQGS
jgi:hypothetical protein